MSGLRENLTLVIGYLAKWNWSAIFAGVAALISMIALKLQRKDLKKQAEYQRNTFKLQHIIEENTLLFEISGRIGAIVKNLALIKNDLYIETIEKSKKWANNVDGFTQKAMGNTIFADMVSAQYGETVQKLENLENKNRALMEELGQEVTKLKINFVTLKSKEQIDINRCCDAFFFEFQEMDDKREKLKELDEQKIQEVFNTDQKHWAGHHHKNIRKIVNDFQEIFITLKKETEENIIDIQK